MPEDKKYICVEAGEYTRLLLAERCFERLRVLIYDDWRESAAKGYGKPDERYLTLCEIYDPSEYTVTWNDVVSIRDGKRGKGDGA